MRLLPFHSEAAEYVFTWNIDSEYRRFWRGVRRFLTFDECKNLPQVMGCEVLLIEENEKIIGLVGIQEIDFDILKFSILIEKKEWAKGHGQKALSLIMNYCYSTRSARYLKTECSAIDEASIKGLEKFGFIRAGIYPEYIYSGLNYEDALIYYHRRNGYGFYC